jgi:hypothetical protein
MRDDLPLRPAFDAAAGDEERPLDLRPTSFDPVQPGEASRAWRIFSIGALGACALGLGFGLMALKGQAAVASGKTDASAAAANFRAIKAAYAAPDKQQVAQAFEESRRLIAADGLSGLARASIVCFDKLSREPTYPLMDYCLALDMLGAQAYARTAGDTAPPSTYFGQGPVRRQRAVQSLIAGQTDANSRIIDTNRLVQDLVLQTQRAAVMAAEAAAAAAAVEAPQPLELAEAPPPPPPPPAAPAVVKVISKPAPARVARAAPPARQVRTRPPKVARAEPRASRPKGVAKPARKPVKPPSPKPRMVAAKPAAAPPEASWPDVLLTRLKSEAPPAETELPRTRY